MSKWILLNAKRRQLGYKLLGDSCVKCGSRQKLEFDHINPEDKEFEIHDLMHAPKAQFIKEIVKCQVLCKSCHSKKSIQDAYKQPCGEHGTVTMYRHGPCRCIPCKQAHSKSAKAYRLRQRKKKERANG